MRRAAAIVLVLVAALAAPLRQACGTTCVDGPEAASAVIAVADEARGSAGLFEAPAVSLAFVTHIAIASSSSDLSPGSPPLRLLALRI